MWEEGKRKEKERGKKKRKRERMKTEEVVSSVATAPPVHSLFVERQMITMVRKVKGDEEIERQEERKREREKETER